MSLNSEHLLALAKRLNKRNLTESPEQNDLAALDTLTSMIEAAEEERTRIVGRLRKGMIDRPTSWTAISRQLGVTKQAAHKRYGEPTITLPGPELEPLPFD